MSNGMPSNAVPSCMENILQPISKHFTPELVGLRIKGNPTLDDWQRFGDALFKVDGAVHWWVGDWINYGEHRYGKKYEEAIKKTGFARQTLMNDASVAKAFTISRRRENLSWSHHAEVAKLPPEQQGILLEDAERNGWSAKTLRQKVKRLAAKELPPSKEAGPSDDQTAAPPDERAADQGATERLKLPCALAHARKAIAELEKIDPDDSERDEAFYMVSEWIEENRWRAEPACDVEPVSSRRTPFTTGCYDRMRPHFDTGNDLPATH